MTVEDLQKLCTAKDDYGKAACRFFIYGVAQGVRLESALVKDRTHFCIPDDSSMDEMLFKVKMKIGQDLMFYPDDKSGDASGAVGAILMDSYPCKK